MIAFAGYIKKDCELLQASSGGAGKLLAEQFIKNGGIVVSVKWDTGFKGALYTVVDHLEKLSQIEGTKYISPKFEIEDEVGRYQLFPYIGKLLNNGEKILFFGLGCYVHALKAYLDKNNIPLENLYLVDLLCHGPALDIVNEKYVDELEKKYHSKLIKFEHRYKKHSWLPKYIYAMFENGKTSIAVFDQTDFGRAFHDYAKPQCCACKYKGEKHEGDICLGDYWGINRNAMYYNEKGVSLIIQQNIRGKKLIQLLKSTSKFEICEVDYEEAISNNPMYLKSRKQSPKFNRFKKLVYKVGLHRALLLMDPFYWVKEYYYAVISYLKNKLDGGQIRK